MTIKDFARLVTGSPERRRARSDAAVLGALLLGDIYVYDIWRRVGGSSGGIYLSLARLEKAGDVWSAWVDQPDAGSRRRRYGVTRVAIDRISWECR